MTLWVEYVMINYVYRVQKAFTPPKILIITDPFCKVAEYYVK